jgi:hypothetical protein
MDELVLFGSAYGALIGQDTVRHIAADGADIISGGSILHQIIEGALVKLDVPLFHVSTLREVLCGLILTHIKGLLNEIFIGHLSHVDLGFKTLLEIVLRTSDLPEYPQGTFPMDFFRKSDHLKKLCHLRVSFLFSLLGKYLES